MEFWDLQVGHISYKPFLPALILFIWDWSQTQGFWMWHLIKGRLLSLCSMRDFLQGRAASGHVFRNVLAMLSSSGILLILQACRNSPCPLVSAIKVSASELSLRWSSIYNIKLLYLWISPLKCGAHERLHSSLSGVERANMQPHLARIFKDSL